MKFIFQKVFVLLIIGLFIGAYFLLNFSTISTTVKADLTTGLVGYWSFDEGNGSIAYDSSGNGNNGIIHGCSWSDGISGNALYFDGMDDNVHVPDSPSLDLTDSYTLTAWVKRQDPGSGFLEQAETIISKHYTHWSRSYVLSLYEKKGYTHFIDENDDYYEVRGSTLLNDYEWYHVAGIYEYSTGILSFYLNGALDNSAYVGQHSIMQTSVPVLIGAFCLSLDGSITRWHFNGSIDEARIYNRALDKDEIEELFLSTGLVGYWSFNEDSESVAVDNSGNMNNGIIFNASHVKDTPSGLGYALAFNRSDKTYVQTPVYQMSIQTISLWFKMHPNQLGGPIASSHIRDDNHGNFILNAKYADECGMIVRAIDGWDPPNLCAGLGPDEYADSTWHYAAFVSNIGDHSLYIDGELKDTYSGSALTDQRIIYFGLNAPDQIGSDYWYDGILDEVRVYNRALSEIEIFAQYEKYSTQENTMGLISFQNPVVCGEEFDINIYIDPCEEIGGWEIFQLNFTQGLVNANKVLPGSSWITNFDNGTIENEIGMITNIQAWTTGPYPDTNHTACTIQFKAIQPGECYIELSHVIVTDSDFEIIDTNTKHLTLNIISLPAISEEYPSNQTIGLGYCGEDANRPPECIGALVNDADGDELYVKIQWLNHGEEWTTLQSFFNVSNGTYIWAHVTDDDWLWGNTTYEWSIHVFDGRFWVNKTFWYHTGGNRYDVTNDCIVNFIDAGKIWVHRTSQTTYDGLYDVNRDGNVNFIDAGLTWVNRD